MAPEVLKYYEHYENPNILDLPGLELIDWYKADVFSMSLSVL